MAARGDSKAAPAPAKSEKKTSTKPAPAKTDAAKAGGERPRSRRKTPAERAKSQPAPANKPAAPPPILPQRGLWQRLLHSLKNIPKRNQTPAKPEEKPAPASPAAPGQPPAAASAAKSAPAAKPAPAANSTPAPAPSPASDAPPAPGFSLPSLDRRLDILGAILAVVGFITALLLLSSNHDVATGSWLLLLWRAFGWAAYLFPFTLMGVGGWLIIRNFESVPWPSVERLIGIALLFANLAADLAFVIEGGGGVLGAMCSRFLIASLGPSGAAVALLAWLLIALLFTLDVTVAELFRWVAPLIMKVQDWWDDFRTRNGNFTPTRFAGRGAVNSANKPSLPPLTSEAQSAAAAPGTGTPAEPPRAWTLPRVEDILDRGSEVSHNDELDRQRAHTIEETLASFSAPANVVEINRGPAITQFGVEPDFVASRTGRMRVRVSKIVSLADDLALALSARTIRIQAPVPGKGYVGIEVPNDEISRVALRDVIENEAFKKLKSPLRFALGQDVAGNAIAAALDAMPHLLVAGSTGSGKSVCMNALICCFLLHNTPDDLRLIMVDPKRVELTGYNYIPHLLAPVVVEMDRVAGVLQWVLREMDNRYHKLAQLGTRNISEYNAKVSGPQGKSAAPGSKKMPRLVVFIDELADLMMLAPDETEKSITRLAQLARATGIHLVIATQRPSVDVVTGLIKANFPARIAFAVASGTDSRVILDQPGAERLLGRGDMLFQAPDAPAPIRIQGAHVSDMEIQALVQFWRSQTGPSETTPPFTPGVVDALPMGVPLKQMPLWDEKDAQEPGSDDPLYNEAVDLVRRQGRGSITMLQRRLRIGYTRSARLVENLQEKGILGKESSPQGFEVLDYGDAAPPVDEQ